jgi:hypothetical protein
MPISQVRLLEKQPSFRPAVTSAPLRRVADPVSLGNRNPRPPAKPQSARTSSLVLSYCAELFRRWAQWRGDARRTDRARADAVEEDGKKRRGHPSGWPLRRRRVYGFKAYELSTFM